ncbi:MAG: serine/threonine-protein phosphatase [Proteobacteria bacterium]|nr:serine/threonine-protein phosphatase [Pseudomonadota bacterium]
MLLNDTERGSLSDDSTLVPAAATDTGCERELNEDRYAVIDCPSGVAWLVCDGMGGAPGGDLAAQIAIDSIRRDLQNYPPRDVETALRSAVQESNRVIVLRRQNPAFSQMGTTMVGALFSGPQLVIGNVGDSRAYLVRDGAIQQLTKDHTLVQELVDRGEIQAEDALSHPKAHVLVRAIGAEPTVNIDIDKFWIWPTGESAPGDFLVLCSDGLYSLVSETEIGAAVSEDTPQSACAKLVEIAKARGGFDNITLAVIPLNGELRREPPPGYDSEVELQKRLVALDGELPPAQARSFLRLVLTIFLLSGMAALLVVLLMVFSLSR